MAHQAQDRKQRRLAMSLTGLGVAVALTLLPGMDAATAAGRAAPSTAPATAATYKTHITQADTAITLAIKRIQARQYPQARTALATARNHINLANVGAAALIGKPPTDPESDDLPGPPAVLAALRLDNRVVTRVVPLFNGMTRPQVVTALRWTVGVTQTVRTTVLNRVTALPAEGDGDDYADGMADTLPMYNKEVAVISHGLQTFSLSPSGKVGLTAALSRARAAQAQMNAAYGGGERPTSQR